MECYKIYAVNQFTFNNATEYTDLDIFSVKIPAALWQKNNNEA